MGKIRIRDGKKLVPVSGINILDPQYCIPLYPSGEVTILANIKIEVALGPIGPAA
jgi:hypothetical protein